MGQQYLAGALLNHFEGLNVQSFDLPTLLSDSTRVCQVLTSPQSEHDQSNVYSLSKLPLYSSLLRFADINRA